MSGCFVRSYRWLGGLQTPTLLLPLPLLLTAPASARLNPSFIRSIISLQLPLAQTRIHPIVRSLQLPLAQTLIHHSINCHSLQLPLAQPLLRVESREVRQRMNLRWGVMPFRLDISLDPEENVARTFKVRV